MAHFEVSLKKEAFNTFPLGDIKPLGWLERQMQADLKGFLGNLPALVPDLFLDPIYGNGRLSRHSKAKNLGNLKAGDAKGEAQYKWWNSETQSNYWDGFIRHAFLLDENDAKEKANQYVDNMLSTQDEDGYIGIYDRECRYQLEGENGEMWAKATAFRALLSYYEGSGETGVLEAVKWAVSNLMHGYPVWKSSPFTSGNTFNGGVSHGLCLVDILDQLFRITKDPLYREYALFLYLDYSESIQSESDAQWQNLLNKEYLMKSHGVHTYEHYRAVLLAHFSTESEEMQEALFQYRTRLQTLITPSGGPIGDEWIRGRAADASRTGYEYCSIHELLHSYCWEIQKSGALSVAEAAEKLFFNAAQGARHPKHSSLAYLKTDNSFEMMGTRNGEIEEGRKQTRYKYSSVHQDVAVCCAPNAARISPYFLQHAWMQEDKNTFCALLLCPNKLQTEIDGKTIQIQMETEYPYELNFKLKIIAPEVECIQIKIRKPKWVKSVVTQNQYQEKNGFLCFEGINSSSNIIRFEFTADIEIKEFNEEVYFQEGPLVYALPISAEEHVGRLYADNFPDTLYSPLEHLEYLIPKKPEYRKADNQLWIKLVNPQTEELVEKPLVPIGKTILRQCTFRTV